MSLTLTSPPEPAEQAHRLPLPPTRLLWPAMALLLTLVALALRVHNLAYESLDTDEADVVVYALADLRTVLERLLSAGDNGPAYMLLVRLWIGLAGPSEFSLRFFSVLPSTLSAPLFYVLGRRLFDQRVGLASAAISTFSTYQLFFAQMNKMYALVVCLTLLSSYLLLRGIQTARPRIWVAYTITTTALMATHVFGVLVVPWHALYGLWCLRADRRHLRPWLASLGALTLPYLPFAYNRVLALVRPETLTREFTGPRDFAGMFVTLAREYGTRYDQWPEGSFELLFSAATVLGIAALAWRWPAARTSGLPFVLLGIAVPVVATFVVVWLGAPLFASRYQIVTLPFYYLLWGGVVGVLLTKRLFPAAGLLLAGFMLVNGQRWAQTTFGDTRFREDLRGAITSLNRQYQPGDMVLTLHDSVSNGVRYYQKVPMTITSLEAGPGKPPDRSKFPVWPPTGRVWLIGIYVESQGLLETEQWLSAGAGLGGKRWFGGAMLEEFNVFRTEPEPPGEAASAG